MSSSPRPWAGAGLLAARRQPGPGSSPGRRGGDGIPKRKPPRFAPGRFRSSWWL